MNAYELADEAKRQSQLIYLVAEESVAKQLSQMLTNYETMLCQQADRIAELEQAIKDADEWLESGEGVSLCYYSFSDSNQNSIKVIKEITG